jgi:integrase/recombinase XerD
MMIKHHKKFIKIMEVMGYSKRTISSYLGSMTRLVDFTGKNPDKITSKNIVDYLHHEQQRGQASSSMRIFTCGIRFYYCHVLKRAFLVESVPSIKKSKRVPNILSMREVTRLIDSSHDLKTKTMIMFFYGTGVRLSELLNFKTKCIDSDRMEIKVLGKGDKERYIRISDTLLKQLRTYWLEYRPNVYFFESPRTKTKYAIHSIQNRFQKAKKFAGITKAGSVHLLRHAFTTHLIESGVPIHLVQKLLGHENIATTSRYLWVANSSVHKVKCTLDLIKLPKDKEESND